MQKKEKEKKKTKQKKPCLSVYSLIRTSTLVYWTIIRMHNSSKCSLNVLLSQLVWFQIKIQYTNIRLFFPIQNIFADFQKSSLHLWRAVRENAMSCLKLSSAGTTNTTKMLIDYKEHRNQFVTENNLHLQEHVAPFPCTCEELWSNPLENIQRFVQPV